jgi:hypothetical protein
LKVAQQSLKNPKALFFYFRGGEIAVALPDRFFPVFCFEFRALPPRPLFVHGISSIHTDTRSAHR